MVNDTNAEKHLAVEASTSHQKRQPVPSKVHDEGENGGGGDVAARRSGALLELNLLDCPVCSHALTVPIFQCENGHIACSSCCMILRNKCPDCNLHIGNYRCRILERIIKAMIVPCPNAIHGCTEKVSHGQELAHEKECVFAPCYCPEPDCNYTGMYKDLYSHYYANYKNVSKRFVSGCSRHADLDLGKKILVLQENNDGPLVVIQCLNGPQGLCLTVNCIAPPTPGVGEFSFRLSYTFGDVTMSFEKDKMNKIQKVSFQPPEKCFTVVPSDFMSHFEVFIWIVRLQEESEEEEEDQD
ncbi:PREDICTED: E3 ubiquitin-protein ligase SINA-like 2 [Camelina sativa]|uniref:RING-type E3 ubiquitin transferase n=1 Tax=Camelina sativa TaxID=90675 RepID=A0ABM1RQ30_CAMSA|nr:PREDICTED: E3 ubiquitin-protein ligase SINA-like 2 [Camelina sativa]